MKQILLLAICFSCLVVMAKSQDRKDIADTMKVIIDNGKLRVTEYTSTPGKDVCGKGLHSHTAHLTILLSDATVRLTMPEGKNQEFDMKAGTTFWSEAETHMVVNNGNKIVKVYLIETK